MQRTMGEPLARILRIKSVTEVTGLPPASVFALMARGRFPRSVRLSARASGWVEAEIQEWIKGRVADRDASSEMEAA